MKAGGSIKVTRSHHKTNGSLPAGSKIIILSTGVQLRLKAVSPFVINEALSRIVRPTVPKQFIESKGREEENPIHPEYLQAIRDYDAERSRVSQEAMFLLGVEVVNIPQGFQKPEEDDWAEELTFLGMDIATDGRRRRLEWLRYWAIRGVDDLQAVSLGISRLSGVPEEDVQKAAESFRGEAPR